MDGNKQQKTILAVYNMSSSKAREVLWALEELADAGIKYNVVNLRRRRADTYKVLKSQFLLEKAPIVTLEHVNSVEFSSRLESLLGSGHLRSHCSIIL